jgi:dipeptidyl aminopeptidase/acylaminoacyl peptidase
VDRSRVALLGASFGGFMTNWIAGHTDRFQAIVTHAGLWALDQQHATTDAAHYKTGIFGTLAEHPEWYAAYSPHNFVDEIATPMLIAHGNRDYRVPVSEALRLWWDLVSRWKGDPADLPHRFLQLTGENHWVLSPANAEIWYDTVLGFCAEHVLGRSWTPSPLL